MIKSAVILLPMDKAQVSDIYRYRAVDNRLSTAGQPTEAQLAAVARSGFRVVINLALHGDPRYSLPDESALVKALGMEYIHIPVQFDHPTQADLLAFFDAMDGHQDQTVFLHCAANLRASAFLGLYRAINLGWTVEESFALMKTFWEPNPVWASFISAMLGKRDQ